MKKIFALTLCLALVPMLFGADNADEAPWLETPAQRTTHFRFCPSPERAIRPTRVLPTSRSEDTISYDNQTNVGALSWGSQPYRWGTAIRLTIDELAAYAGYNLIAVVIYRYSGATTDDTLIIYGHGTPTGPGPVLHTQTWTPIFGAWNRIDLTTPILIDGVSDIWIHDRAVETAAFPFGMGPGPYVAGKGDWACDVEGGEIWMEIGPLGFNNNFNIWAIVAPAAPTTFWDFETGWQGWIHTNALSFPEAWDVLSSGYKSLWTPPDAGDSTMWIDSDAAGIGVVVEDTAISPAVVPPPNMMWLKYGLGYNNLTATSDSLSVGIITFSGGVWNPPVELRQYNADFGPAWDSIDVSAYATADSVRIYFWYMGSYDWYAGFDNVGLYAPVGHDVGCISVASPPAGLVDPGNYDVIGQIHNFGASAEDFDVTATVYDTTDAWNVIFDVTETFTAFPVGADSFHNFGTVTFDPDKVFYTEIYTELADDDPSNDTSSVYSRTAMALGDIVFVIDTLPAITGYPGQYGMEFDGTYFYVSSAFHTTLPNAISVIDTLGNLVWSIPNGTVTTYGMRDLAWDGVYAGADRIDTLYASDDNGNYQFGINLTTGTMDSYTPFTGPPGVLPCRALGWDDDDEWFFTANWDPLYKFQKDGTVVQGPVSGPGSCYGCAYDTDDLEGHYVWWHGQTGPYLAHLTQMNPSDMTMTGVELDIPHTISGGIAGGLCFYEGFRGMDVLFALIQGDGIYGIFVRWDAVPGVEEQPVDDEPLVFGFAPSMANPTRGRSTISYTTTKAGKVSLKVYDGAGRFVETLVNAVQPAGAKTVNWDVRDIPNGVYFLRLEAEGENATHKLILVK